MGVSQYDFHAVRPNLEPLHVERQASLQDRSPGLVDLKAGAEDGRHLGFSNKCPSTQARGQWALTTTLDAHERSSVLQDVTKAVIPAAGLGTRLKPLTAHMPKELLPIGEKPMIQYTLEMYMASGISELCIITSPQKGLIKDFVTGDWLPPALPFSRDEVFYKNLGRCRTVFLSQKEPKGVADAISLARDFVDNQPFACVMPDCLLFSKKPMAKQLMRAFRRCKTNVMGTIFIRGEDTRRFGNVGVLQTEEADDGCPAIISLSDKKEEPLSGNPGAVIYKGFGGGIYLPEYFHLLEATRAYAEGELDDVPIHQILVGKGTLVGIPLEGVAFDAGHPLGYRAAARFAGR